MDQLADRQAGRAERYVVSTLRRVGGSSLGAVVAVALLSSCQPAGVATSSPSIEASSSAEAGSSESPTTVATQEPTPTATAEQVVGWQQAAIFGADGFIDRVSSLTRAPDGFIAVGVHSEDIGPLVQGPHEGRIWHSPDGRSWEDVTPPDFFVEASLAHVFMAADGSVIAHGWFRASADGPSTPMAWESPDGRAWSTSVSPFPDGPPIEIAIGAKGYLALLGDGGLWLSTDGHTWEMTRAGNPESGGEVRAVAAGDDGFIAIGSRLDGDLVETHAIASSDGRTWFEATAPPTNAYAVAARGGDWIATGQADAACGSAPGDQPPWSSANGLDWTELGVLPLRPIPEGTELECWRVGVSLSSASGPWLVATAVAGPACCDNPPTQGTRHISRDGASWESLALPGVDDGSPSATVTGAIAEGNLLILVGTTNQRAAFWFNEAP